MGSVNYTQSLRLPQFSPSDKPTWQGDLNAAFKAIDDANVALQGRVADLQAQIVTLQNKVGL